MFISISLFLIKWIYPFFEFFNEDLILKTINESESDGYYYFPLIKYLSDLTFNLSFELGVDDLNLIPIPLGGILFHSLLLKITNNFFLTIFIIEFISLFLFLTIFYFLFRIVFKSQISIILSLIILLILHALDAGTPLLVKRGRPPQVVHSLELLQWTFCH